MSRMIACLFLGILTAQALCASDVEKYPPGQNPFHSPKAPVPNGVFASDACYGYHVTKWTPWHQACGSCTTGTTLAQSCTPNTPKAIIIYDSPAATPAPPAPGAIAPAPESPALNKPMPPVKK